MIVDAHAGDTREAASVQGGAARIPTSEMAGFAQNPGSPPGIAELESAHAERHSALQRFFRGRSLDACVASGRDNLLILRLIAALFVVFGHSSMGGVSGEPYDFIARLLPGLQIAPTGLMTFFLISGLLVTLSYQRRPHLARFLRARMLRLWPGLLFCLAMWAWVLGPLLSTLPLSAYFAPGRPDSPFHFVYSTASMFGSSNHLPGLFYGKQTAAPGQVDTPLWSLMVESRMYLWVAGAGVLRLLRLPWVTSAAIAGVMTIVLLVPMTHGIAPPYVLTVQGFFAAGAIACLLRRYIPISTGGLLLVIVLCILGRHTAHALPIAWLTLAYSVLWFAYVPRLPTLPAQMDLSYGIYLWGWPMLQTMLLLTDVRQPPGLFLITTAALLPIAALSWFCIEKPALRLKDHPWLNGWGMRLRRMADAARGAKASALGVAARDGRSAV